MSGMCLDDGKIFKKVAKGACNFQKMVYSICSYRKGVPTSHKQTSHKAKETEQWKRK